MKDKNTPQYVDQLSQLFMLSIEGTISEKQHVELTRILKNNPVARDYYYDFIASYVGISEMGIVSEINGAKENWPGQQLWAELLNEEKTAPTIEIEKPIPEKVPVKVLKTDKEPRTINKFSLYSAIISIAAVIFLLIYIKFAPTAATSVATIADSMNAQWEQSESSIDIGQRLWNNEGTLRLEKGMVKVEFDYGAEVLIEGPAEFEFESAERMALHYGRIYARVPKYAIGFTVDTPSSTVIDLGTYFGVDVDDNGNSEIGVFTGKVFLCAGSPGDKKSGVSIVPNQAKRVSYQSGDVSDISRDQSVFVQKLLTPYEMAVRNSKPLAYWRFEGNLSEPVYNVMDPSQYQGQFIGGCRLKAVESGLEGTESNSALVLDGQGSSVKFENIVHEGMNNCSILLWVKPDSDEAQNIIASSDSGPDYNFSLQLRIGVNKQFEFYTLSDTFIMGGGEGKFTLHADDTVQHDRWYFLAATIDGHNKVSLYIDGELAASTIMNDKLFDNYPDMYIGCPAGNKRSYPEHKMGAFRGAVDDVAFFNRCLDENEIKSIYNSAQKD